MTRKEAIETLHEIQRDAWPNSYTEKACEMAIEALEQEPSNADSIWDELSKVYNMDDVPEAAKEIIGDVMLSLHEPEPYREDGEV